MTDSRLIPDSRDEPSADDLDQTRVSVAQKVDAGHRKIATLVVLQGDEIGRHIPLRRNRVVLGRSERADVVLRDDEISREHAEIEALRIEGQTTYHLVDLQSTNHVYVNGDRHDAHALQSGDKIQLGGVVLRFELQDALDASFHREIRDRIRLDELTGLLTYKSFCAALEWELARSSGTPRGCSLAMMDLDDFKRLNDTHGHLAGTFVLEEVGDLIRDNLRHFDVAARYGGEEFVVYLPETEVREAVTAMERLRRVLERRRFRFEDRSIQVTISIGLSHFPEDARTLEPLIQVADERLYRVKRTGKNRVCFDS